MILKGELTLVNGKGRNQRHATFHLDIRNIDKPLNILIVELSKRGHGGQLVDGGGVDRQWGRQSRCEDTK